MQIKQTNQPEFQKVPDHSFQELKKQCTFYGLSLPPNLDDSRRQKKNHEYLQVNYLKNILYKVSPTLHTRIPLQKEQQNLRDYLMEVQNDSEKRQEITNGLKSKFFLKNQPPDLRKLSSHSQRTKNHSNSMDQKKQRHESAIQIFDPIEYLHQQQSRKKKMLKTKNNKMQEQHMFCSNVESVKYISEVPDIKIPGSLPTFTNKLTQSGISKISKGIENTQNEINKSIQEIMQKSIQYQSPSKNSPNKLKHYKSRNQLKKANDKKIQTQRKKIMGLIHRKSSVSSQKHFSPTTLNDIPAKEKYAIDFISYLRTKTKDQLDKHIYEKLVKKPEKDLQKFQEFMLKEVKFENEENKHKMERFFIKMRQEFRRIQKYSQQGSKFDWRSKSMHLDKLKKENQKFHANKLFEQNLSITENIGKSIKIKNSKSKFSKVKFLE